MNNKHLIIGGVVVLFILIIILKKESFYNLREEARAENDLYYRPHVYTNQVVPAMQNNSILTKTDFQDLFENLINSINANGPPGGANTNVDQIKYDLLFKDILINSNKRNTDKFPNPNKYSVYLNLNIDSIYKAELIEVYIPAATDNAVNIPTFGNRLYFTYTSGSQTTTASIFIQAGTYLNPETISIELARLMNLVLTGAGFVVSTATNVGISVKYDRDLNRYIFSDYNFLVSGTLIIYPTNGYVINLDLTVEDSVTSYIMLDYEGPDIFSPYTSGPTKILSNDFGLYIGIPTNYGEYTDSLGNIQQVPTNADSVFSNSILSGQVLTNDKIYLSLGKLNGTTCNIVANQNPNIQNGNIGTVFCQIPNNTSVSSASIKTMLNQPSVYSAIQFYNPPISKINNLEIAWYDEDGSLLRILDHSFTVRLYYFQKRFMETDFSIPIP